MGQGMWVWRLSQTEQGDQAALIDRAAKLGLTHVVIKVADGGNLYNGSQLRPLFDALRARGIKPYAWAYDYGEEPEREAEIFGERAVALEAVAAIANCEGDAFLGSPARAQRYISRLRHVVGDMHIGLSTHRFPSNFPGLPIGVFMEACDSGWPQCYYIGTDARLHRQMERVKRDWEAYHKPIVVTGAAYPEALPDVRGISQLGAWCTARGVEQMNWWVWQTATAPMWSEIAALAAA